MPTHEEWVIRRLRALAEDATFSGITTADRLRPALASGFDALKPLPEYLRARRLAQAAERTDHAINVLRLADDEMSRQDERCRELNGRMSRLLDPEEFREADLDGDAKLDRDELLRYVTEDAA